MSSQFIEKYEVLETLGKGSMGVVYKARDPEIGRMVAIKTLKAIFLSEDAVGQEALQRFRQESRSAGRLHHPNIVTIFEAGRAQNGSPYIVMEYIEGASLENLVRERGALEPLEAFHYLAQIASAIDYALSQNIIHRDIKPSNIIIDLRHRPFLLDFGVAKLSDTSLTPAGTVVGTPSYMSPEQIRGENLDGRSDLFSFAVVTYEVLTGKRPFPGNDFTTVVSNILQKPPLSFTEVGCSLPKYLEGVLAQGLARERERRFSTASAFIDAAAQTLGISLDNTGLIGGFRPGMKLSEMASGEHGGRVRAPTVHSSSVSSAVSASAGSGASGGARPAAGTGASGTNLKVGGGVAANSGSLQNSGPPGSAQVGSAGPASSGAAASGAARLTQGGTPATASGGFSSKTPTPAGSSGAVVMGSGTGGRLMDDGEDAETRVIAPGQDYFKAMAENAQQKKAQIQGQVRPGKAKQSSAALYAIIAVLLLGIAAGAWLYLSGNLSQVASKTAGTPGDAPADEDASPNASTGVDSVGNEAIPSDSSSASNQLKGDGVQNVAPSNGSNSPSDASTQASPVASPASLVPVKPQVSFAGITASDLRTLRDEEIAWILSEQKETKILRLAIDEVGERTNHDLILRLTPLSMHQDYAVRINVIKTLSRSGLRTNPEVMAIIVAALSDSEFLVRGFAAKTLAAIGTPEAVKALVAREGEEKNQVVLKVIQDSLATLKKN